MKKYVQDLRVAAVEFPREGYVLFKAAAIAGTSAGNETRTICRSAG